MTAGPRPVSSFKSSTRFRPSAPDSCTRTLWAAESSGTESRTSRVSATPRCLVPSSKGELDVVLQAPGLRGPYTVEDYRQQWGPFAPAARKTYGTDQLNNVRIELVGGRQ